jgi:hypothetical protein
MPKTYRFKTYHSKTLKKGNMKSYEPTINKQLNSLKSLEQENVYSCSLKKPLHILIHNKCYLYSTSEAQQFLLKNLSANKHLKMNKLITPKQYTANCWFNVMFVCMFISDKGRRFFHFFRTLMITGKLSNGDSIPSSLKDGFALLNYNIESCLTGTKYAYVMNTDKIIDYLYKHIPKKNNIYKKGNAGNPFYYYQALVEYLSIQSIYLKMVSSLNPIHLDKIPHVIVLQYYTNNNDMNKKLSFSLGEYVYQLDSACIIDNDRNHFCSLLMCNGKEYGYDGMSYSRLESMEWKKLLNKDENFFFKGSTDVDNKTIQWNFMKGYQMLVYYRKK